MSTFTPKSESRTILDEALAAREATIAEQDRLRAARDRLATAAAGASAPERALAVLDQEESAAAAAWAHSPEGTPAPVPDIEKRARIAVPAKAGDAAVLEEPAPPPPPVPPPSGPPTPDTPAAFGRIIAADTEKWAKVIQATGAKAE